MRWRCQSTERARGDPLKGSNVKREVAEEGRQQAPGQVALVERSRELSWHCTQQCSDSEGPGLLEKVPNQQLQRNRNSLAL